MLAQWLAVHVQESARLPRSDMNDRKRVYPERLLYRVVVVLVAVATGIALVPMWLWVQGRRLAGKLRSYWR